jgi:hypothetical protein
VVVADVAGGEQPASSLGRQSLGHREPPAIVALDAVSGGEEQRQGKPVAQRRGIPP